MTVANVKEKSQKQLDNELRENVKLRLAEGFETEENEMLIDNGSSLVLRTQDKDVEIKIIVKKDRMNIEIEEEEE